MKNETSMKTRKGVSRQRRNTVILITVFALLLLAAYLIQTYTGEETSGGCAVIQVDGKTVHMMDLDQDQEYTFSDTEGHFNKIAVRGGGVRVTESDCKNQICVNTGEIKNEGEVIACLPHRMIIYID